MVGLASADPARIGHFGRNMLKGVSEVILFNNQAVAKPSVGR